MKKKNRSHERAENERGHRSICVPRKWKLPSGKWPKTIVKITMAMDMMQWDGREILAASTFIRTHTHKTSYYTLRNRLVYICNFLSSQLAVLFCLYSSPIFLRVLLRLLRCVSCAAALFHFSIPFVYNIFVCITQSEEIFSACLFVCLFVLLFCFVVCFLRLLDLSVSVSLLLCWLLYINIALIQKHSESLYMNRVSMYGGAWCTPRKRLLTPSDRCESCEI